MTLQALLTAATARVDGRQMAVNRLAGDTLRRLRNLSAHLSEDSRSPDERAATQAVLILALFIEGLAVPPAKRAFQYKDCSSRDPAWMRQNWANTSPTAVGKWVRNAPPEAAEAFLGEQYSAVLAHLLSGGVGAFKWLAEFTARSPVRHDEFVAFAESNMVALVKATAHTSALQLTRLTRWLGMIGLRDLQKLLRVMLPLNEAWFEDALVSKSPAWLALSVREWRNANPEQWRRLGNTRRTGDLAALAWTRWDGSLSFAVNRMGLCQALPSSLCGAIVRAAPSDAYDAWFANALPTAAINLVVRCLRDRSGTEAWRQRIYVSLLDTVAAATVTEACTVPGVLAQKGATEGQLGQDVFALLLSKAPGPSEWSQMVRLVWSMWSASAAARPMAAARAYQLALRGDGDIGDRLSLAGVVRLSFPANTISTISGTEADSWSRSSLATWASVRTRTAVRLAALGTDALVETAPQRVFERLDKTSRGLPQEISPLAQTPELLCAYDALM